VLGRLFPGAADLQNPHPLLVHFPIAFLYGAAFFYFIAWIARRDALAWPAMWMLVLGLVSALAAVATGLWGAEGVMLAPSVKEHLLAPHKWLMIASSALAAMLTLWAVLKRPMPSAGRPLFLAGLVVMVALIAKGADYGGRMVYDYNAGGGACSQPIQFNPKGSPAM
jgi:uncharacterized membrane protein